MSHWRDRSRVVISAALADGKARGLEGKALEKHVSEQYPFGVREYHPYRIWRHEFRLQVRGERRPFEVRKKKPGPKLLGARPGGPTATQGDLFE